MTTMLEVSDVTVSFDGPPVLDAVSLSVAAGEVVALLGPSGSGKSTLLRVIAGLVVPDAGRVRLAGTDITTLPTHRRGVGMVFQNEQLFPHRDVRGNLAFGLRMRGDAKHAVGRRVNEMLELVGLSGFADREVSGLSGGEAKRVALARSLAPAPRALLLDEPLTGLDRDLHTRLAGEVARILRAAGTTALLVTHDATEAATIADRVVRLDELSASVAASAPGGTPDSWAAARVVEITPADTHALRRRVLRNGSPTARVVFDGDDASGTVHLGLRDGLEIVGVSTWLRRPCPVLPSDTDRQLRGMAVATSRQSQGLGAVLLAGGIDRARADGATVVWANARDTAIDFYVRNGFTVEGDGFVDPTTELPHHVVRRRL